MSRPDAERRSSSMAQEPDYKLQAAERALTFIEPGMKLGLGTGSTASKFIEALARRVRPSGT